MKLPDRIETIASVAVLALVIVGSLMVLRPFMSAILWAGVLCYCTWPIFARLKQVVGLHRRTLAALVMTILLSMVLVLPFVVVGVTLAGNVAHMGEWFQHFQGAMPQQAPAWVSNLPGVGDYIDRSWGDLMQDTARTSEMLQGVARTCGKWALSHSLDFGMGVAQMILSVLVAFVFYRDGERVVKRIVAGGRRILGDSAQRHVEVVGRTIRSVVYGVIGTGLVQAILAGIGFWITRTPSPFLLGLLTFLLSFIPVGPPLVWVPAAVWLFSEGRDGWGVFMALWGFFGISGIDNIVKPLLIQSGMNLPFVTILMGVLGGVLAFGFIGLFIGPVLLAVAYNLVREFTAGTRQKAQQELEV